MFPFRSGRVTSVNFVINVFVSSFTCKRTSYVYFAITVYRSVFVLVLAGPVDSTTVLCLLVIRVVFLVYVQTRNKQANGQTHKQIHTTCTAQTVK